MDEFQLNFIRSLEVDAFENAEESVGLLYKLYDMTDEVYPLKLSDFMPLWIQHFRKIYGWNPPFEALHYINDLLEGETPANLAGLDLNKETVLLEYRCENLENFKRLDCFGEGLASLFGIFPQGVRNYRDYELISLIDSGNGLSSVYYFEHEEMFPLNRKGYSISEAYLNNILLEYEQDGPIADYAAQELKDLINKVQTKLSKQQKTFSKYCNPEFLIKRGFWLVNLKGQVGVNLEEVYIYNHIANAPSMQDWLEEIEHFQKYPWLLNYWLLAHYYLNNRNALIDAIELSKQSEALMTQYLGKMMERELNETDPEKQLKRSDTVVEFCPPECLEINMG